GVDLNQGYVIGPEISEMLQHAPSVGFVELGAFHYHMAKHQPAIAGEIDIHHLYVRVDIANVILPGEFAADAAITARIVDRIDLDAFAEFGIVVQMKQPPASHQPWRQELADEAFVAIIGPDLT